MNTMHCILLEIFAQSEREILVSGENEGDFNSGLQSIGQNERQNQSGSSINASELKTRQIDVDLRHLDLASNPNPDCFH